ncbi:Clan MC, family M14, Zinc carboxypeptidase-like metallopeptidase [Histomonas meleagridis]|uniref:Clan MC, family M14, Zinc carboxypeptidase-like metallopeptidase n=1 Tax=Histomonas meleagridis TaxID=135588 RepID=UPI003559C277|nr:Clan MC, family M14, Zinc carboxypeptidase-like metallopeptidase [Histomonas meleagridis]KAH0801654.1 Clan MC, family M14, Zinc carboxypeptidase-like metallopeptidase [Histomonas meleagridis]
MESQTLPDYQCKPKTRLEIPISLQNPNSHPGAPMIPCVFKQENPDELREQNELIYDPMDPNVCKSDIKFSGNFECGNLGKVYQIGDNKYEIHILPDPNDQQSAQWFFFKVESLKPGVYYFIIVGFYRQCNLHFKGSQACAYSQFKSKRGIGWHRIGEEMNYFRWKTGKFPEWAWSFKFTVEQPDTMYFAHSYPYTYTDMLNCVGKLQPLCKSSTLCQSVGGLKVPVVFWDADQESCVDVAPYLEEGKQLTHEAPPIREENIEEFSQTIIDKLKQWGRNDLNDGVKSDKKPVIVIAARTHPGETNSSFAIEGLMQTVFANNEFGVKLRKSYSWLIIPMINPDGVICGFYRPSLSGDDINRVWQKPDPLSHPIAHNVLNLLTVLRRTRPIPFFLDFHGHTGVCNSFVYGFMNDNNPAIYKAERIFPLLMTKHTNLFSNEMCSYLKQEAYEGTMRVVLRRKFLILFAYTLEMSFGGSDFGPRHDTQFTPHDFREIGVATAHALDEMFSEPTTLASREVFELLKFPENVKNDLSSKTNTKIEIEGTVMEGKREFFRFNIDDISTSPPKKEMTLKLKQLVYDKNYINVL